MNVQSATKSLDASADPTLWTDGTHVTASGGKTVFSDQETAIKTLETELHATLFERTTRRVQLTAAGAALLPEARRALAAARAGADAVDAVQGLRRGHVGDTSSRQTR